MRLRIGKGPLETVSTWPFRQGRLTKLSLVETGVDLLLRQIGQGAFATVYEDVEVPDRVWITIQSGTRKTDPSKEIVARILQATHNPYLPYLREVGQTFDETVYVAPKLQAPLRKDNVTPTGWKEATVLAALLKEARMSVVVEPAYNRGTRVRERFMVLAERSPALSPLLVEALSLLHDAAYDYGYNFYFEFPKRNLASDTNGHLVLLDVLFDQDRLG